MKEWKVSGFPKALITLNFFFFDSSDIYSRYQNFPEHKTSKVGFLVVSLNKEP